MGDVLPTLLVLILGIAMMIAMLRGYRAPEARLLIVGFTTHVFSAFAQVWITRGVYGGGDMLNFYMWGAPLAQGLRLEFADFLPEVLNLIVQRPTSIEVVGVGNPTGTMVGVTGILLYFLDDSLYASCVFVSLAAFFGTVALYRVFREVFPRQLHIRLLIAAVLVPSVVFWSAGILKETLVMAALGPMLLGVHRAIDGRLFVGLPLILAGAFIISISKPYTLFALIPASGVWLYWRRSAAARSETGVVLKPIYFILGGLVAVGGVVLLGELFPRYSVDRLATEAAHLQEVGAIIDGGSRIQIADSSQRSLAGQLTYAPMALLTVLFRPSVIDVNSATVLVNALETTGLTLLLIRTLIRHPWHRLWRVLTRSPTLMFGITFVLTFGVAVGLASTNLGTLSRYRIPLMPFLVAIIFVWDGLATTAASPVRIPRGAPARPRP